MSWTEAPKLESTSESKPTDRTPVLRVVIVALSLSTLSTERISTCDDVASMTFV